MYMARDAASRSLLNCAELAGRQSLDGSDSDLDLVAFIYHIITELSIKTNTETVTFQLQILTYIHVFQRNTDEAPSALVT